MIARALKIVVAVLLTSVTCAAAEVPARPEVADYATRVEEELRNNILPFWLKHSRDKTRGGFYGQIDRGLAIQENAARGALLTSRILWTFSAAYRRYRDPAYLEMARWAYEDLNTRFTDGELGGLYWRMSADGAPIDPRKIVYVQAFGIYGLSEFHRATGDREPLDRAIALYRLVERHARDPEHRGYFEEFSRDWKISRQRGLGRSAMGSLGPKSQNVHLHVFEAYANLFRAWPDAKLKKDLRDIVDLMLTEVLNEATGHLHLFLEEDWTPRSQTYSFGHDIEAAWLLTDTAELLGDPLLIAKVKQLAVRMADVTLREGVDPDGGVLAEANSRGFTNTFKEWWPQAEAAVGFLNAFQISGDRRHWDASRKSWDFIETHLVDRAEGDWFQGVSRDGQNRPSGKQNFWKGPYHNGRACMELIDRLRAIDARP